MVVDLLPGQADPRGQRRRRGGRGQLGEESTPHRLQGHRRRGRIIDNLDVEHEEMVALTTFVVKDDSKLFLPNSRRATCMPGRCPPFGGSSPPPRGAATRTRIAQLSRRAGRGDVEL